MNRENEAGTHYSRQMLRQLMLRYVGTLLLWAAIVLGAAVSAWFICAQFTWYEDDPLYRLLRGIADYLLFWIALTVAAGWLVISYRFLARPVAYLRALAAASAQLVRAPEEPVELPAAMKEVQDELNQVREQSLRSARAAREAEQRKNDLIMYLAHDLKTPLTSVIGYLTLLRDEPDLPPAQRARFMGIAMDKALRLEELINEFFDITRFNLSRLELELQLVDLRRMLEQVCSEFEPVLAERDLHCRLSLPPALPCRCDPDKLARVFDNLLRNAAGYGRPGTDIEIGGAVEGEQAVLTFRNHGRTIPPEKLERIFEQFFRLDGARGSQSGGAGLGLAIARQIVELHGGDIRADSADEQVCFTVRLPLGAVRKT